MAATGGAGFKRALPSDGFDPAVLDFKVGRLDGETQIGMVPHTPPPKFPSTAYPPLPPDLATTEGARPMDLPTDFRATEVKHSVVGNEAAGTVRLQVTLGPSNFACSDEEESAMGLPIRSKHGMPLFVLRGPLAAVYTTGYEAPVFATLSSVNKALLQQRIKTAGARLTQEDANRFIYEMVGYIDFFGFIEEDMRVGADNREVTCWKGCREGKVGVVTEGYHTEVNVDWGDCRPCDPVGFQCRFVRQIDVTSMVPDALLSGYPYTSVPILMPVCLNKTRIDGPNPYIPAGISSTAIVVDPTRGVKNKQGLYSDNFLPEFKACQMTIWPH